MLIKIREFPDQIAAELMALLDEKTGSKAVAGAALGYREATRQLAAATHQLEEMKRTIAHQAAIIENARASAAALLDKTAQGDML